MYGLPKGVCCACDPSVHLDVPSIGFVCRKLSPYLRVWELDHRCLFSPCRFCVVLNHMWSGKSLQLLRILPFGIL